MGQAITGIDTANEIHPDWQLRRLQFALRFVGIGWMLFFAAITLNELLELALWDRHSLIGSLVMWGHGGHEYLLMLCAINIPLGAFLTAAATAPHRHRMFIDFAVTTNIVHLVTMLVMAVMDPAHHTNLTGDVPAGLLPNIVLAVLWWPIRARG